jgi:hypothetical protein
MNCRRINAAVHSILAEERRKADKMIEVWSIRAEAHRQAAEAAEKAIQSTRRDALEELIDVVAGWKFKTPAIGDAIALVEHLRSLSPALPPKGDDDDEIIMDRTRDGKVIYDHGAESRMNALPPKGDVLWGPDGTGSATGTASVALPPKTCCREAEELSHCLLALEKSFDQFGKGELTAREAMLRIAVTVGPHMKTSRALADRAGKGRGYELEDAPRGWRERRPDHHHGLRTSL